MLRRIWTITSLFTFGLGLLGLALTAYLWVGDWPRQSKELVDHYRSLAENYDNQGDPLIINVLSRQRRSLGGTWQALIDPFGRGDLAGAAPRAMEPASVSDLAELSFENGLTLEVPGDWNTQDPRLVFYTGVAWYKRSFEVSAEEIGSLDQDGRRRFLWLGAANYTAAVYLNGELVGRHRGGFTPFNYEIGPKLKAGSNLLVIRVDNRKNDDDVPTPMTDWHNYGGLTRDVMLLDLPATFIREYEVQLAGGNHERIAGFVQLDGSAAGQTVVLRIEELGVDERLVADEQGRAEFEVPAAPKLWSPDSPKLYAVELRGGDDVVYDSIGFRTVGVRGSEILLNGEPIFLRGISIHEEAPGPEGRAHSAEHARELLGWVREMHGNFVRLAHYPHSEHMALEADRLGLLVWEEIPVYWAMDFGNEATLQQAKDQLTDLITRDRNRASVILWSIGNETPASAERQHFMSELADHVRATDASRPVTAALLTSPAELAEFFLGSYILALLGVDVEEWTYRVSDPLADVVDVQALNEYFGWYYSGALGLIGPWTSHYAREVMLENMHRIRLVSRSDKPLVVSELGAGARYGMRAPEADYAVFSEDYQALVYRRQIEMLRLQPNIAGVSPWILKDFRSPLRLYQGVQDYWNLKGLVSDTGQKKQAFGVLRDWYMELDHES